MATKDQAGDLGPFGNPDGSRAQIERLIGDFVDFGGDQSFGALATRADDSMSPGRARSTRTPRNRAHPAPK